jgi:hypothetical protein
VLGIEGGHLRECLALREEAVEHRMDDNDNGKLCECVRLHAETVFIHVYAAKARNGNIVAEELPAFKVGVNLYRLAASPGLAPNMAKGDVVMCFSKYSPVEVVERGGNVCVQIYADDISHKEVIESEREVAEILGGSTDVWTEKTLAFSIPVSVGFENIERLFNYYSEKKSWIWCYGNVYDVDDGVTPLNWWKQA